MVLKDINIIAAVDENNCIGKDGKIPWHCSEDLAHFKKTTTGHAVIMGRKTFDSLDAPLPNRFNIVLSRKNFWDLRNGWLKYVGKHENLEIATSLMRAFEMCCRKGFEKVFVAGGEEVYGQALNYTQTIYLTRIHGECDYQGDAFFPVDLDKDPAWDLVSNIPIVDNVPYLDTKGRFAIYERTDSCPSKEYRIDLWDG